MNCVIQPRSYQIEMFERSLEKNIIVAMDTGSGKTQIICSELERLAPDRRVWFLAPTVDLCRQQHGLLQSCCPSAQPRLLVGTDGVDRWSTQSIWDAALQNTQVVVSTHAVLADALTHGFVKINELALLIFDEAHHCTGNHPANVIMQQFYHPSIERHGPLEVPRILGMSASLIKSNMSELKIIEANLDSICVTPRIHREELLRHVHRPSFERIDYEPSDPAGAPAICPVLARIQQLCESLKVTLGAGLDQVGRSQSAPFTRRQNPTLCQLNKFLSKATHIYNELGSWATAHFVLESVSALARKSDDDARVTLSGGVETRKSLLMLLDADLLSQCRQAHELDVARGASDKFERLLTFLDSLDAEQCSGLIFVQQRVTVSVLCTLLSHHPRTSQRFRCSTFVGMSNNSAKKSGISELLDVRSQRETLSDFRARKKNLIITTNVLEEGIDVTACNLVLCFDPPDNVKSFIQRRGRARQKASRFALMLPRSEGNRKIDTWHSLEQTLTALCLEEQRAMLEISQLERSDVEIVSGRLFVERTGACISPDSAVAHLHHFCACLPHEPYVDHKPTITFSEDSSTGLLRATVTLPTCLTPGVRTTHGLSEWRTERAATRDGCFEAYKALHDAGLLDDHLLPLSQSWAEDHGSDVLALESTLEIRPQYDPWREWAAAWTSQYVYQSKISISEENARPGQGLCMTLTTPCSVSALPSLVMHWDHRTTFRMRLGPSCLRLLHVESSVQILRDITQLLIQCSHSDQFKVGKTDFIALVSPQLAEVQLSTWIKTNKQRYAAMKHRLADGDPPGLVRPLSRGCAPHIFRHWSASDEPSSSIGLACSPLMRRRNFLESGQVPGRNSASLERGSAALPAENFPIEECTFDHLPMKYVQFGMLVPSIFHWLQASLIAEALRTTVLSGVPFQNTEHITTAITTPSAGRNTNYQRYEFIGDAVLKFIVSHQLYCDHEAWPEGYLTRCKSWLVSNQQLARAALNTGLDAYVIAGNVKMRKWKLPSISEILATPAKPRQISRKMLADVVEALVGAAYIDGGLGSARACIHLFLPRISPESPHARRVPPFVGNPRLAKVAEKLIGYTFTEKTLLVQSLTHPSYPQGCMTESYQRLEFLGDAVLEMLVVRRLITSSAAVARSPGSMTMIKSAVVNAPLLAFLCIDCSAELEGIADIVEVAPGQFAGTETSHEFRLSDLMQHVHKDILESQSDCLKRYNAHRNSVHQALLLGKVHPWLLLARLNLDKYYSDLIEAVIGAIFLDSDCDLAACDRFIARLGLTSYVDRLLMGEVDLRHPKSVLGHVAGKREVTFSFQKTPGERADGLADRHACQITVGEVVVANVNDCLSKEEASIAASIAAVARMTPGERDFEYRNE